MGMRELVALLYLSSYCLVIVVWLFLTVPWFCLKFVIALFPDYTQIKGAECFAYCILTFERIPYLSVFQWPYLLETSVCLGLLHFMVIYTCFNPKAAL